MIVLSLGGGVQSTTVLLMMEHGEIERADYAVFADTGWEPRAVYEHLDWLRTAVSIPIVTVSVGNIYEDTKQGRLPRATSPVERFCTMPVFIVQNGKTSMLKRQCTHEYKVRPIYRWIREQLRERREKICRIALGISLDEVHRMRDSDVSYVQNWYPLVDLRMRRSDCLAWLQRNGYPTPPKSSCLGCPFHDDAYWRRLRENSPNEWAQVVEIDALIRRLPNVEGECYLHRSCKPIEQAVDDTQQELQFDECTGFCFT